MPLEMGLSFSIFGKRTCVMGGQAAAPEERYFAQCAEHGLQRVELTIMEGYLEPGDWASLEEVRRLASRYGVTVDSVHGPSGWPTNGHWLADPEEQARRRNVAERVLALEGASRLGARYMVVEFEAYDQWPFWPHGQPAEKVYPQAVDQWTKSFEELLTASARLGITLAIENVDGVPNHLLPGLLLGLTRAEAGVCFDSSHATYGGNFAAELKSLAPWLIGTHLSDNDALPGAAYVDRHWFPFTGAVDWPLVVREIAATSSCPCLMVEVLDRENPQISPELMQSWRRLEALLP
jgi:sugar phosphate isomerase/epimerase